MARQTPNFLCYLPRNNSRENGVPVCSRDKSRSHRNKSHNRTERDSQGVGRDILISKKLFLEPCGQFPVTQLTSGEIVDFRKTRLHPKKNGGQSGTM